MHGETVKFTLLLFTLYTLRNRTYACFTGQHIITT